MSGIVKLNAGKKQGLTPIKIFNHINKELKIPNIRLRDVTCKQKNSYILFQCEQNAQKLLNKSALTIDDVYCELSKEPCATLKKLQLKSKKPAVKFSDDRFKTFDDERLSSRPDKEASNVQERINNKVAQQPRYVACDRNKYQGFERNDNFG